MQGTPIPTPETIGAQPVDAELTAIAALPPLDGNFIVGNGTTWVAESGATAQASLGATVAGSNFLTFPTPGFNTYLRVTSAGVIEGLAATDFRAAIGAGTVASVAFSGGTTGLTVTGSPVTSSGTITLGGTLAVANGGTGATNAAAARSNLGAGTVTSVAGSGGTTGLTVTGGPVTTAGTLTLGGTLAIANGGTGATTAANALTALGAASATHTHLPTVVSLTPINSFTGVNGNQLIAFPALGLCVVFFSVARTSVPTNGTNILSWSATYTSLDNTRVSVFGVQGATVDNIHCYLTGTTLQFYKLSGAATAYDVIEGQILFRYTP